MSFSLAQINVAKAMAPMDDALMADFVANLDPVNALAEAQDGFVWRLTGDGNDATDLQAFDDPSIIINMSVWRDMDSLASYVYRTDHRNVMRRRKEWFHEMEVSFALWWIPAGHRPTPQEGRERLERLMRDGPTPDAFTFRNPFPAPDALPVKPILETCE